MEILACKSHNPLLRNVNLALGNEGKCGILKISISVTEKEARPRFLSLLLDNCVNFDRALASLNLSSFSLSQSRSLSFKTVKMS